MRHKGLFLLFLLTAGFLFNPAPESVHGQAKQLYFASGGTVHFKSDAPQEFIQAKSNQLRGLIDPLARTFVFKVTMRSFEGFNSELQREHFNEKYLESEKFPEAVFNGKIIEDVDLKKPGTYAVRAKGVFSIHGVDQERIIKATVTVGKSSLKVESNFNVLLSEHNIRIPKVVHEKIASEINVEISAEMSFKSMN